MPLTPTRKQPLDATLTALAGVTTAADKLIYATGADAFATTDLTSFGRSLLDDANAAAARSTLGLVIGTDVASPSSLASYLPLAGGTLTGNLLSSAQVQGAAFRSNAFNSYDNGFSLIVVNSGDGTVYVYGNGYAVLHLTSAKIEQRNGTTSQTLETFHTYTDASNYQGFRISHSAAVSTLSAITAGTGADDVDIALAPAGAGRVAFGAHTALGAEVVTGYIEIKDAGGTVRKLAVIS